MTVADPLVVGRPVRVHHRTRDPLESYFSLYPPGERGLLDPDAALPKVVKTHDDVAACLEAYRGPTLDSYPVRVLINYIDWKLHTGKTDEQVVSKLELLEIRFPSYVHAFAMVREARRFGPSDVIPMGGLTPLDRTTPNVMAALRALMRTRKDVIYCLERYPGIPSDVYPGEVVLRYLDLKKHRGKTPKQLEAKLERLERLAYAFARYGRGLGPSRVLTCKWPSAEDEMPPATPRAAEGDDQNEVFTDTDGSVHIVRYFVEPAPLGARALSLLTMDSLFDGDSDNSRSSSPSAGSDTRSARSDSASSGSGSDTTRPRPVDSDEYKIIVPFKKVRGRKM
ncbi:uncharacterized protein LOC62_05G007544 [Vanrija pseudolonga]|uniref:Uncharacterized protein n=1 Tax=Vanrija pseudolonga TaxID=143232 RepID=A0AAF0YCP3_9TREE|nr:hypothetical protein LOC62_05G007544 [Vanrija pseudolonga]